MKSTEIITYCGTKERIEIAFQAGANHIIIDHPFFSIRSLLADYSTDFKSHYKELIKHAKDISSDCLISIQCDIMMHQEHQDLLTDFADLMKQLKPDFIRVQDAGLITFFQQHCPLIKVTFMQEMGNANTESVKAYSKQVARQQFSLDLTYTDMTRIKKSTNHTFECLIQGPLLIQHSKRRYLAGLDDNSSNDSVNLIHRIAQDEDYPGRRFDFYDNQHGHFMYAYFDRSLLRHIPDLLELNVNAWIIDARGESDDYLKVSLELYIKNRQLCLEAGSEYELDRADLTTLSTVARKPQKPGFFKANQTDKQRYNTHLPNESDYIKVGRVLDISKGKRITIELNQSITTQTVLYAFHPKLNGLELSCDKLWDLKNAEIKQTTSQRLVQIAWVKGIQQNSLLFIKNT